MTHYNTASYDALVKAGAIGSLKRDVLLEGSRDLEYLRAIASRFGGMSSEAKPDVIANTVRLVEELIGAGFCRLATWGEDRRPKFLDHTGDEIASLVERSIRDELLFSSSRPQRPVMRMTILYLNYQSNFHAGHLTRR
jgi:hypothetical protein